MNIVITIVAAILVFGFLIFIHELGHFLTAKWSGIKVNEFALGMGPAIFKFTKGETTYALRAFPIGGFCAMEGEDGESTDARAFSRAPVYKRIIVCCAGAVINIIFGFILVSIIVVSQPKLETMVVDRFGARSDSVHYGLQAGDEILKVNGHSMVNLSDVSFTIMLDRDGAVDLLVRRDGEKVELSGVQFPRVYCVSLLQGVTQYAVDGQHGLKAGDKILKVNGQEAQTYNEIGKLMYESPGGKMNLTVNRDGTPVEVTDIPVPELKNMDMNAMQYDFATAQADKTFFGVIKQSFADTIAMVKLVWNSLFALITGQFGLNALSGPVGVATVIGDAAAQAASSFNILPFLSLVSLITINLGVFNLLPLPALDGGRLVFLIIEGIRRKPVNPKYEGYVHAAGMILLMLLMVVVTFNDIVRLITGG